MNFDEIRDLSKQIIAKINQESIMKQVFKIMECSHQVSFPVTETNLSTSWNRDTCPAPSFLSFDDIKEQDKSFLGMEINRHKEECYKY